MVSKSGIAASSSFPLPRPEHRNATQMQNKCGKHVEIMKTCEKMLHIYGISRGLSDTSAENVNWTRGGRTDRGRKQASPADAAHRQTPPAPVVSWAPGAPGPPGPLGNRARAPAHTGPRALRGPSPVPGPPPRLPRALSRESPQSSIHRMSAIHPTVPMINQTATPESCPDGAACLL